MLVSMPNLLKTKFKKIGFLMIYPSLPPLVEPSVEKLRGYWFFQIRNSSDGIHILEGPHACPFSKNTIPNFVNHFIEYLLPARFEGIDLLNKPIKIEK